MLAIAPFQCPGNATSQPQPTDPEYTMDSVALSNWGATVVAAANQQTYRVAMWWQEDDLTSLGLLPYLLEGAGPLNYGGQKAKRDRVSIEIHGERLRFQYGEITSEDFQGQAPRDRIFHQGDRPLPIIDWTGSFKGAPQNVCTLAGIVSAFRYIPLSEITPGCVRAQLGWRVPPATIKALAELEPIEIRHAPTGEVAFCFTFEEKRQAYVTWFDVKETLTSGGMVLVDLGNVGTLVRSDPNTWPILVDSLADL